MNVPVETVTVPKRHISRLLTTLIEDVKRGGGALEGEVRDAVQATLIDREGIPANPDDPWTLPADTAWWLVNTSYALGAYDLDECAKATYEHPAVIAEMEVQQALDEQAPATTAVLNARRTALIDGWAAEDRARRDAA